MSCFGKRCNALCGQLLVSMLQCRVLTLFRSILRCPVLTLFSKHAAMPSADNV